MGTYAPEHCPHCGAALRAETPPSVYYCEACAGYVFHDPSPNARVAVVDGDSLLLVEIADEARLEEPPDEPVSEWMLPGGHLEIGEQPHVAAARELREETGHAVGPDDLVLFEAISREVVEGAHGLVVFYAVERATATGALESGSDAADARFWTPSELDGSDCSFRDLHDEPDECTRLGWWVSRARAALTGSAR